MNTSRFSLMAVAALAVLSSTAMSQQAPGQAAPSPVAAAPAAAGLALGQIRPMTAEFAKQLVAAAKKGSCAKPAGECSGAFAIVDDAGVLVYLETIDGVLAGGPELAARKAKTSALWRRPTQVFLDAVKNNTNSSYADGSFPDMTTSPGGIPLVKDGRIVGGFGTAAVGSVGAVNQINAAVLAEATRLFGKQ